MNKLLVIFFCFPLFLFSQNWNQIGQDIDGQNQNDFFGYSVSMNYDGSIVAIGTPYNDDNGQWNGQVRILENNNGLWIQKGGNINGGGNPVQNILYHYLGYSVSLNNDGNTVAIGAPGGGYVEIYNWDGSSWNQIGSSIIYTGSWDREFGHSVSISSDGFTVAIGAPEGDGNGTNSGFVRVYNFDGNSWIQLGGDIDGESANDFSGWSVSLSSIGNTLAIGAYNNDGNGVSSGHVRIYEWNGSSWIQLGQDIDGETALDNSGYSVSISSDGNIVAIGAEGNNGNGIESGHVRIYEWNGISWNQIGQDIDGQNQQDRFGTFVSISSDGNTVAIGALQPDVNLPGYSSVYKNIAGNWVQQGQDIYGEANGDQSCRVSISGNGNMLAVGATFNDGNSTDAGHVRLYTNIVPIYGCTDSTAVNYDPLATVDDGSCCYSSWGNVWDQIGQDIDGQNQVENSGHSVSMNYDGSIVAIGVPYNDDNGQNNGQVRILENNNGLWVQKGGNINGGGNPAQNILYHTLGYSVSLNNDGNTVAIGAPGGGYVKIYNWDGSSWNYVASIIGSWAHEFGYSVSISSDGLTVAIGAPEGDGNGTNSGFVRVYNFDGNSWIQLGSDLDGEAANNYSGHSLSISSDGSRVAIGAYNNTGNFSTSGHVRVYDWNGSSWVQLGQDIDGEGSGDGCGYSVSLNNDGNTVAIGAPFNSGAAGHVRIYNYSGSSWIQIGNDIDGNAPAGAPVPDQFGQAVSLSSDGNTVAIGAPQGSWLLPGYSSVYKNIAGNWVQQGQDIYGEANDDQSFRVSISGDGSTLAVGAVNNNSSAGHVRVYGINTPCSSGCTDSLALNYDANALIDDGSCLYCNLTLNLPDTLTGCDSVEICANSIAGGSYSWLNSTISNLGQWNYVGTPEFSINAAYDVNLVFNQNNIPYVAYIDGNTSYKYVKKFNGSTWELVGDTIITSGPLYNFPGNVAFDEDYMDFTIYGNTPYIAFKDNLCSSSSITVMKFDGVNWINLGNSCFTSHEADNISIAVDDNGVVYVAFEDHNPIHQGHATLMKYDVSNWVYVGSSGFSNGSVSYLDLQINGSTPYLTYSDSSNGFKISVKMFDGINWVNLGLDGFSDDRVYWCQLDFKSNGDPIVAFRDQAHSYHPSVMKFNGVNWTYLNNPGFGNYSVWHLDLEIDANDVIYLAATECDTSSVFYPLGPSNNTSVMRYVNSNWQYVGNQFFSNGFTTYNSLKFDNANNPYIAFKENNNGASVMNFNNIYSNTNCIWVDTSGNYYLTVTDSLGCTATDSVYVFLNIPVSGSSSVSACDTYTWEGQTITSSGNLIHTYQNAAGCDSVHTLSVTINSSVISTSNPFICSGNSIVVGNSTYSITGIYVDSLSTVLGCDSIITTNLTVWGATGSTTTESACDSFDWNGNTYNSSGTYTFTTTNVNGCDSIATLELTIFGATSSTIIESACDSYDWNGNTYNSSGTYTFITTNANGCDSIATLELTLSLLDVSNITTNTSCYGATDGSAEITVTGGIPPYIYLWDSGQSTQDLIYVQSGNYVLTVTDANLCSTTLNISIDEPQDLEAAPYVTNASCEVSDDASIDITPYGGTIPYTYLWSNGQITEDLQNIQIGEYTVLLTDFNGCEKLESVSVSFDGSDNCLFIPTLFTPNGDGIHDTWIIDGLDLYPDILVLVFNRWGQLLFESKGYSDPWDGTHNGNELPIGAYYYVIDLNNDTDPLNGPITIKR